jgi:hypothetical protein
VGHWVRIISVFHPVRPEERHRRERNAVLREREVERERERERESERERKGEKGSERWKGGRFERNVIDVWRMEQGLTAGEDEGGQR